MADRDRFTELSAPAHWRAVDFISDLHLQASSGVTLDVWLRYLQRPLGERPDALFILGDLFEVWVGDDVLDAIGPAGQAENAEHRCWRMCAAALLAHSRQTPVFFMHGNRDFLLGATALAACGMRGIPDPTVLTMHAQRWLLSHGDALCLADSDYMRFRAMVRQPNWQRDWSARPLAEREAMARALRAQSEVHKQRSEPAHWTDVDRQACCDWLQQSAASTLIHGHTHQPARHDLGAGRQRVVLSDWDASAQAPRAELLRLDAQGLHRQALPL